MTPETRDPRYWVAAVDHVVDAGMIPVRLPGGLVGARFPTKDEEPWPASLTPEGRADLRAACVAIRRLVDHEDLSGLFQCASDCLRELNQFTDERGA